MESSTRQRRAFAAVASTLTAVKVSSSCANTQTSGEFSPQGVKLKGTPAWDWKNALSASLSVCGMLPQVIVKRRRAYANLGRTEMVLASDSVRLDGL